LIHSLMVKGRKLKKKSGRKQKNKEKLVEPEKKGICDWEKSVKDKNKNFLLLFLEATYEEKGRQQFLSLLWISRWQKGEGYNSFPSLPYHGDGRLMMGGTRTCHLLLLFSPFLAKERNGYTRSQTCVLSWPPLLGVCFVSC